MRQTGSTLCTGDRLQSCQTRSLIQHFANSCSAHGPVQPPDTAQKPSSTLLTTPLCWKEIFLLPHFQSLSSWLRTCGRTCAVPCPPLKWLRPLPQKIHHEPQDMRGASLLHCWCCVNNPQPSGAGDFHMDHHPPAWDTRSRQFLMGPSTVLPLESPWNGARGCQSTARSEPW